MKSKSMSGVVYRYSKGTEALWACIGYNRCVQCHAVWLHTEIQNDHNCHFLCASHKHDMCVDLVSTIYVNHTTAVLWLSNHQALPSAFWTIFATQSLHIRQMCWWVCQMIQTKIVCFQMWQISIVLEGLEFPDMSLGNQVSQVCMDDDIGCSANFWHSSQCMRYRCLRLQGQIFRQETFFRMSGYLMPAAKQIV